MDNLDTCFYLKLSLLYFKHILLFKKTRHNFYIKTTDACITYISCLFQMDVRFRKSGIGRTTRGFSQDYIPVSNHLEISVYHWYLWNYHGYCFFINPQTLKIGIDQKKCFLIKLSVKPKEWVSDCCLMLFQQLFSYIMARTS
jgi:hypothetical protein